MVIIIEGIDRVGKTTLCEMIEQKYADLFPNLIRYRDDTRYAHNHLNMQVNSEKINTLQNLLEAGLIKNIILDRYHITEFVYGAVDRSYKNFDMYDIDHRLAELSKPDTPQEGDEGYDEVDPGMTFTGKIWNEVILIYVVPTDINLSSMEHGYNLERHLKWFNDFYDNTEIRDKIKVDYNTLGEALDFIDEVMGIKEIEEEPESPEEPVEPEEPEVEDEEYEILTVNDKEVARIKRPVNVSK